MDTSKGIHHETGVCIRRQRHRDRPRSRPFAIGSSDGGRGQYAAGHLANEPRQARRPTVEALRQERGRDLQAKQKELEDIVRQLVRDSLPQADRERLSQDESRRRTELQQLTEQAQADFQATQRD